jgi:cell division protease FtsH
MNQQTTRKWIAIGIASFVLLAILSIVGYSLVPRPVAPASVAISEVLNRADKGEITKATITGDSVLVTDKYGHQFAAIKESSAPLSEELRNDGVEVTVTNPGADSSMLPLFIIGPIFAVGLIFFMTRQFGGNAKAFNFGQSKARMITGDEHKVTFSDVAGVEEAKCELQEVVQFLADPERFRVLGARIPRGVLLIGPPGTGKTLISKAVAGEAKVPFFSMSGSEFVEMFVVVGASRVRDLFKQARKHAPSIIFVDEIDAVGRQRGPSMGGPSDERDQTLNQLLVEMDGFDSSTDVIVIAATNRPDILDEALLRPGRFDRRVNLEAPDINGRKAILSVHAKGKPLSNEVDLGSVAEQTTGFSGADLANLLNEAAILAARSSKSEIEMTELEEAVLRVLAGPERKSMVISQKEKDIIAYHEVGHALVMKSMEAADPVQKISVISRGKALGLTVQTPKEDRHLMSKKQLFARMAGAMGGRVAEEIVFGDVTTGAQQDIKYVTDIARRMVCEFGMSEIGTVNLPWQREYGPETFVSETMSAKVDAAVVGLVDEAYKMAKTILRARLDDLKLVAEHLKIVETIPGAELDHLLAGSTFKQSKTSPEMLHN